MTTGGRPVKDELVSALDIYRDSMRELIVRRLRTVRGQRVEDLIMGALRGDAHSHAATVRARGGPPHDMFDVGNFYFLINNSWDQAFAETFRGDRSVLSALRQIGSIRADASHPSYSRDLDRRWAAARLYDMSDVLGRIGASSDMERVQAIYDRLTAAPSAALQAEVPVQASYPVESERPAGRATERRARLKPWREVMPPRYDVASGQARQSEFAASLSNVYSQRADLEYVDPFAFFRHTYITDGIETLLVNTLKRLGGTGGEPVIQARTVFGGGKTHSLIALYHMVNSGDALINPGANADASERRVSEEIRGMMLEAGLDPVGGIPGRVAVIDCNEITVTTNETTPDGDPLNTLWGVIAYQLGGQEAYDIIGDACRRWTSPGTAELRSLFEHVGPCVILIDELVAYARNIADDRMLGVFFSFVQYLTEAVRQCDSAALVMTLPEHEMEAGSEAGRDALERLQRLQSLEHITARIEATWHPLETQETFEVIRRRLFGDEIDEAERDRTCEAFARMYRQNTGDYPTAAREPRYLERLKECYPIHPQIFDRIFGDWSARPGFQRTRGVLRVMAAAVSRLNTRGDSSPLIMPGSLPVGDTAFSDRFFNLLGVNWDPVRDEVDSDNGKLDEIDGSVRRFRDVGGAARRIARAVFLASMPDRAVRGIDVQEINIGVVQPGDGAATYRDALGRMTGKLYYMYQEGGRYFFHNEQNLNSLAADRVNGVSDAQAYAKIVDLLRRAVPSDRRRDGGVVVCDADTLHVADIDRARLIVLPPTRSIPSRESESGDYRDAHKAARGVLMHSAPGVNRVHRNTLVFLAARRDDVRTLADRTRVFMAWDSIVNPAVQTLNLTGERRREAGANLDEAKEDMDNALANAYRHILAPEQPDGQRSEYDLIEHSVNPGGGEIISAALSKLAEEELLLDRLAPEGLMRVIDGPVWKESEYHIGADELWRVLTSNVHVRLRLRERSVLNECIEKGVQDGVFGYAGVVEDESGNPYPDVKLGEPGALETREAGGGGVLVRKDMAEIVIEERRGEDGPKYEKQEGANVEPAAKHDAGDGGEWQETVYAPPSTRSVTVRKTLSARGFHAELATMGEEIVRNLFQDGEDVIVSVEVVARKSDGFSEGTLRSARDNSGHLGMKYGDDGPASGG